MLCKSLRALIRIRKVEARCLGCHALGSAWAWFAAVLGATQRPRGAYRGLRIPSTLEPLEPRVLLSSCDGCAPQPADAQSQSPIVQSLPSPSNALTVADI